MTQTIVLEKQLLYFELKIVFSLGSRNNAQTRDVCVKESSFPKGVNFSKLLMRQFLESGSSGPDSSHGRFMHQKLEISASLMGQLTS